MKILVSILVALVVVIITACTPQQPLTRAECEKAGKKWDENANVCIVG
jgi:hypothetical protein